MSLHRPTVTEIAFNVYLINEFGIDCQYIICGEESALVIDTGTGYHDFKALINEITDLPYKLVFTHGSNDHSGQWDRFDEVYIHPCDLKRAINFKERRLKPAAPDAQIGNFGTWGDPDVWGVTPQDVWVWSKEKPDSIQFLYDGMVFPLGGRNVRVIYTPAHTPGHCAFLDDKSRILFSGDCCNTNTLFNGAYVSWEWSSLKNIEKYKDQFDRNFNGHVGFGSDITNMAVPATTLDDAIAACEEAMENKELKCTWRNKTGRNKVGLGTIYGAVRLTYDDDMRIAPPGAVLDN